jgi:uncharacterized protein (TIGR03000 family)
MTMLRQLFSGSWLLAVAGSLALVNPAPAQQPVLGLGRQPFSARGPLEYGRTTLYGADATYTGKPLVPYDSRPAFVTNYTSTYTPVFYTSINYPGIYGAYTDGVASYSFRPYPQVAFYPPAAGTGRMPRLAPTEELPTPRAAPTPPPPTEGVAYINVHVPPDASLRFQGTRMSQGGSLREFVSPPLPVGKSFVYTVRASWPEGGREITRERQVQVRAGDQVDLDFLALEPRTPEPSTLKTRPLPPPAPRQPGITTQPPPQPDR